MQNLIYLFARYGGVILFFSLEALYMYLVVEYNQKQSDIYTTSSNKFISSIYDMGNDIAQYLNLSATNDSLAAENARLYAQLDNAKYVNTLQIDSVNNELYQQRYTYISAKVNNATYTRHNNYLTIDKGAQHGIRPGMGVVSNFGVVGIITSASENFSTVLSILHRQSGISASIKGSGHFGRIVWQTNDPKTVHLIDIAKHAEPTLGDTIQTSGFSTCFPEGIMIGTIKDFDLKSGSNFYDIEVNLSNDLSNIQYVYVVNNLTREEQLKLEQEVMDE